MFAIYKREMRSYFTGAIGYVFLVIFLAVAGVAFAYTTLFSMTSDLTSYYTLMLLFSAIVLPILTMKSFSEEKKTKTEQLLLTAPVSIISVVAAKFLASFTMFVGVVLFTALYALILLPYGTLQLMIIKQPNHGNEDQNDVNDGISQPSAGFCAQCGALNSLIIHQLKSSSFLVEGITL